MKNTALIISLDYCIPVSDVASRRHLRSARRHYRVVPRHSLSSYGRRTFAVVGPTAWNSLSDDLRDPTLSTDSFRRLIKTRCFQSTSTYCALEVSHFMCYINSQLTYFGFTVQAWQPCPLWEPSP